MHTIEAMPPLLGIPSGFVTGIMAGLGIAIVRSARTDFALATLDRVLVVLSLVAAFGLGMFVSLMVRMKAQFHIENGSGVAPDPFSIGLWPMPLA